MRGILAVEILEQWRVIDKWWSDNPTEIEWAEVIWWGRKVIMYRRKPEETWRVWNP